MLSGLKKKTSNDFILLGRESDIGGTSGVLAKPNGIRIKDRQDVPLDIIVYATGYFAYSKIKRMLSFQVYGWNARNLNGEWETEIVSQKGDQGFGLPSLF